MWDKNVQKHNHWICYSISTGSRGAATDNTTLCMHKPVPLFWLTLFPVFLVLHNNKTNKIIKILNHQVYHHISITCTIKDSNSGFSFLSDLNSLKTCLHFTETAFMSHYFGSKFPIHWSCLHWQMQEQLWRMEWYNGMLCVCLRYLSSR